MSIINIVDPRIQKAVDLLKQIPLKKISVSELAVAVGLSESRLGHLFTEHVGIPVRRYLMWLRLIDAFYLIFSGGRYFGESEWEFERK